MPRGGRRPNAGRKRGSLTRKTSKTTKMALAAAGAGELPLEYMLRIMRDDSADRARRDDMAKAAAGYVHPRLAAMEHSGSIDTRPASQLSDDELASIAAGGSAGAAEAAPDPSKLN